mmetsp:Transcript_8610/g.8569  ORF Transcript_8610/g.8569 Transcript_8610/m.8569 type:complete len:676 (+) Transcript_8610:23-2050(+)
MAWWKKGASATTEESKPKKKEEKEEVKTSEKEESKSRSSRTTSKESAKPATKEVAKSNTVAVKEEKKETPPPVVPPTPQKVEFRAKEELAKVGTGLYKGLIIGTSNKGAIDRIRANFEAQQVPYNDPQFPPQASNLAKDFSVMPYSDQRLWKSYQWKRASEMYSQPIKVFNNIDPNDIKQGSLGDCYFLSTLSAIAEFPNRIQKLFDTQEYQPSGCYTVNICDQGIWNDFVVDDYFPYDPKQKKCAFSGPNIQSGVSELWVLLLEKAWAKRFGSYWAIDGGFAQDALRDLTGGPCEVISIEDDSLWQRVLTADQRNFIITASSSGDEGNGDAVNELGLVTLHAYSVIAAREVTSRRGPEKLLQIRNPWGEQEWQGDWSDNSDLWTPELKQELGWSNVNDGTFWMAYDDFADYFSNVTICRVHDDYYYEALHYTQSKDAFAVFKVTLANPGETYFISTQVDDRVFGEESGYQYSPTRIIAAKLNENYAREQGNRLTYITATGNFEDRDVWVVSELEAGTYLIYVEVDWLENFTNQLGFSVYSASPLTVEDVTFRERNFIQEVYNFDLAKATGKALALGPDIYSYALNNYGYTNDGKCKEGFAADAIENNSKDLILDLDVIHKTLVNLELTGSYAGSDTYKVVLRPGEKAVVVKKQIDIAEEKTNAMQIRKKKLIPL